MVKQRVEAVVTDLDGTLFKDNKEVGKDDLEALRQLGNMGVLRIAATGRNLRISKDVLPNNFPIDYLVFSTGAGIYDWHKKEVVATDGLPWAITRRVIDRFLYEAFDFTIHLPIPENHRFYYHIQNSDNKSFMDYISCYANYGNPFDNTVVVDNACQLLAIIETNTEKFDELTNYFNDVKLIRTTSPLNGDSMWIEVFPKHISKAWGVRFICDKYGIGLENVLGVGNDYNDIDFLEVVGHPRVVANAHPDLLKKFLVVASNEACGVAEAINSVLGSL